MLMVDQGTAGAGISEGPIILDIFQVVGYYIVRLPTFQEDRAKK